MIRKVAIVVFDESNLLDIAGPAQVFRTAAEQLIESGMESALAYEIVLLSVDGGTIESSPGIALLTTGIESLPASEFDTVLVSGGHGADKAATEERLLRWVRGGRGKVRRMGSICTGAFILAAAGLLNGRRAATHWGYCGALQASYPDVDVDADSIFVEDSGCWTSAGVTSGMDMSLAMVEEDYGRELSLLVARRLVVFLKRPGGQSQFSAPLAAQSVEGPLAPLIQWIVESPAEDLRTESLADRSNMSLRNFYRAFQEATGLPPAEWVENVRLQIARRLLEQSAKRIDEVAQESGFGSADRMRRVFLRRQRVSPSEYRQHFARPRLREQSSVSSTPSGE